MEWLTEQGQLADVGWFFCRFEDFLFATGYWEPLLRSAERVATWAESVGNPETLVAISRFLISVFRRRGTFVEAETWLERAQVTATRLGNEILQAEVWLAQGRLIQELLLQKHSPQNLEAFSRGVEVVTRSLDIFYRHGNIEKSVRGLNTLGNLYLGQRHFEEAMRFYQEGLQLIEKFKHKLSDVLEWEAILRGNLGLVAGRQGRYAEACEILYDILNYLTDQTDFAEVHAALAFYEFRLGNSEQAHLLRRRADRIIEKLNLARPICEEDAEWMQFQID